MVDAAAAVVRALATTTNQPGYCLATVNGYFGYLQSTGPHAGQYPDAIDVWDYATDRHPDDRNPPAGAVVLWGAVSSPRWAGDENYGAGDICLSLGGGMVRASDYPTAGRVGTCSIGQRTNQIGRPYLGWCGDFMGHTIDFGHTVAAVAPTRRSRSMQFLIVGDDLNAGKPMGFLTGETQYLDLDPVANPNEWLASEAAWAAGLNRAQYTISKEQRRIEKIQVNKRRALANLPALPDVVQ